MDLWQLQVFCKVVESGSFSRAGEIVHLSQPTVSSHIKDLETHLDCRLIDRLSRQAQPTKAGEILYEYAQRLLRIRDEAETAIAAFQGKMIGGLTVGGSTIPAAYLLPGIIGGFTEDYPQVRISVVVGDTDHIIRETLEGRIEVGVVGARPEDPRAEMKTLVEDELQVVVPASHPLALRATITVTELQAEPFVMRERGSGTRRAILQALAPSGLGERKLNVVAEMGSTEAVYRAVKAGIGISILSTMAVAEDVGRGELHCLKIDGVAIRRRFYLVRDRHRSMSPLAKAFCEHLEKRIDPDLVTRSARRAHR
jgi:DNA-binding transcriptional LysR family regulator